MSVLKQLFALVLIFMLGWTMSNAVESLSNFEPLEIIEEPRLGTFEQNSPSDWIKEEQIRVYQDRIEIDLKDAVWAKFTNTNSMDPVLDETANAIEIIPTSPEEIHPGDIVSYKSEYSDASIIHRVLETGYDDEGWFAIMKGDNNPLQDPGKVRFKQVRRVVVAIIY